MNLNKNIEISIVCPVYNAENILRKLTSEIVESVTQITNSYELIFIEDGGPDNSWNELIKIADKNTNIKLIKLSRNFGQHNAIFSGMEKAKGNYVVVLDCDLQHNPKYILNMYNEVKKGYDIVMTKLKKREHQAVKNNLTKFHYAFLSYLTNIKIDPNISNYSMLSRKAVIAYNQHTDNYKTHLWTLRWIGFSKSFIEIEHQKRHSGKSSYNLKRMIPMALNIAAFNSNKLLFLIFKAGSLILFFSVLLMLYIGFKSFYDNISLILILISLVLFLSGLTITILGIIAFYIAKVFDQSKNRQRYIIDKTLQF